MGEWANDLARRIKPRDKSGEPPAALLGTVVENAPLKVSLYGGEIFAPPMPLRTTATVAALLAQVPKQLNKGDSVLCAIVGTACIVIDKVG